MPRHQALYSVTFGLRGCYMPDSVIGPMAFATRRELVAFVKSELQAYDLPASAIRQISLRRIWSHIARHGSSVAHFAIYHGANALEFHGLTQAEFDQMEAESDQ